MIRACIIGATGYAGAELVDLLSGHDDVDLVALFGSDAQSQCGGRSKGQTFDTAFPRYRSQVNLPILPTTSNSVISHGVDAVFLATPHEVSHDLVPELLAANMVVFDLSAAFRLRDQRMYVEHYGFTHMHPNLLCRAVYGLAERNAMRIAHADLIAVPGCYPTSVILPLSPLIDAGLLDLGHAIIADCTSGVSGAGRAPALKSLFCEVSFQPYGVLSHRHTPEIEQHVVGDSAHNPHIVFTPHLAPYDRGIVSTIHARLSQGVTEYDLRSTLHEAYDRQPFVRMLPGGAAAGRIWPSVNAVRCTNFCDIGLAVDQSRSHLVIVSAIDNVRKGAAGQAVQCMNIRFGFHQTKGFHEVRCTRKGEHIDHDQPMFA